MAEKSCTDDMKTNPTSAPLWNSIVRIYRILSVPAISMVMIFLSWFTLFHVEQVTDAIVALGNFGKWYHFIIFCLIGTLWAFLVWYWARVFYYIDYQKQTNLKKYEKKIIEHTPRVLGALALLIIGFAFLAQAPSCQIGNNPNPIRNIGVIFIFITVLFILFTNIRRRVFSLDPIHKLQASFTAKSTERLVPVVNLQNTTRKIILITTIIVILLLILLIIAPISLTSYLGDGVTILIGSFCIWLPLLYWVHYGSLKVGFPLFLVLTILVAVFSLFNSNKNIRLVERTADSRKTVTSYYQEVWYPKAKERFSVNTAHPGESIPLVIVLSEGGGIRAAYWSAQILARIQKKYPNFRDYLFCISGVSGGSFGATVFDSLLYYYDHHPRESQSPAPPQSVISDIVGKDYLSPTIACMFTRQPVQLLVPFPISSFDHAKVFENTWELYWQKNMNGDLTFGQPFLALWSDPATSNIPPLFLNVTQVENGYPVIISHLSLDTLGAAANPNSAQINHPAEINLPRDFYNVYLNESASDVRISTASLLSARFPYVGPAGTLTPKNSAHVGLVDGGYFDNTGANTAYQVLEKIMSQPPGALGNIIPVIVYLKNGIQTPPRKIPGQTMLYQLFAPIDTFMHVRDANTVNHLLKLQDLVNEYRGDFITYSLQRDPEDQPGIPLGWALSKKAQVEIDNRIEKMNENGEFTKLEKYLQ